MLSLDLRRWGIKNSLTHAIIRNFSQILDAASGVAQAYNTL